MSGEIRKKKKKENPASVFAPHTSFVFFLLFGISSGLTRLAAAIQMGRRESSWRG